MNIYVKNHGSVNTNGNGFRIRGGEIARFVKQQQDYERGERFAERKLERDKLAAQEKDREIELARIAAEEARIAAEEAKADKDRELERDRTRQKKRRLRQMKDEKWRGSKVSRSRLRKIWN